MVRAFLGDHRVRVLIALISGLGLLWAIGASTETLFGWGTIVGGYLALFQFLEGSGAG